MELKQDLALNATMHISPMVAGEGVVLLLKAFGGMVPRLLHHPRGAGMLACFQSLAGDSIPAPFLLLSR